MTKEVSRNNQYVIYGRILRKEREEGYYIGSDITKKTGLSKQLISDIEIGNKNVSFEKIRIYASFFDLVFDEAENRKLLKEMNKIFFEALDCLIYADPENFVKLYRLVVKDQEKITHSKCADFFYLFEMIYSFIINDKTLFQKTRDIIDKYFLDIYDSQLSFLYWLTIGNYYNVTKRWEEALNIFRRIREAGASISVDLQAMLYYSLGTSYRNMGNPVSSMTAYQKAKTLFDESNNYIRSLYISAYMGKDMMSLYRYEEAAILYDNLMKTAQLLNDENLIHELKLSIIENYFFKGDFEQVLVLSERWTNERDAMDIGLFRIWSYYKLGNESLCKATLDFLVTNYEIPDNYHSCVIRCIQSLMQKDDRLISDNLIELYRITESEHLFDIQEFLLDILTEVLNRQENYVDAVKYYEVQIAILRRKMNDTEHLEAEFNYSITL